MKTKLKTLLYGTIVICTLAASSGLPIRHVSAQAEGADGTKASAQVEKSTPPEGLPTNQIIIRYQAGSALHQPEAAAAAQTLDTLSRAAGVSLTYVREMSGDAHVLGLPGRMPEKDVWAIAQQLMKLPGVEYAEPDSRLQALATPNDPNYTQQWHYFAPTAGTYGINLPGAWDVTTGTTSIRVAVIDTGLRFDHPDLAGRTVPGYDFVTDVDTANDGGERDGDAADPGDWVTQAESDLVGGPFEGCQVEDSSWHGTHVAGTIGAASNNGLGVTGINWQSPVQPVRVLGKCGGLVSDIVDGIRWAAGLSVAGVPTNTTPARVLNMSLGGSGSCSPNLQGAITAAYNAGAVVVVAAGNSNLNASGFNPANCDNVITVASTNRSGFKADYSNFGSVVEISAPGGDTFPTLTDGVLSTLNSGATTPVINDAFYQFYQGTSMASPHVAGVASLVLSVKPSLSPAQVLTYLMATATPFPNGSTCSTSTCGAGIVNAAAAVALAGLNLDKTIYLPLTAQNPPVTSLANGNFESGHVVWAEYSLQGWPILYNTGLPPGLTPHSGSWLAWLGGDDNEVAYIQQPVTVSGANPYLSFWNWIASGEPGPGFDVGTVQVNGVTVATIDMYSGTNTGDWAKRVVNLSAYSGQAVTLRIQITTDGSVGTNWFIDDVGFQSTP